MSPNKESYNTFSEASRRFCQAIADRDWATVNQFLAPEVRRDGKFVYSKHWLTVKPGAVWRDGQSIPFKGEKLIGRESDICILTVSHIVNPPQKTISGTDIPGEADLERLDLWREQKTGELVVIPEEQLLSSGI